MDHPQYNILLADDDLDDCLFFQEALDELPVTSSLTTVNDGEQLMHYLNTKSDTLPDLLFLDLNMPRKSGFECLYEIKGSEKLKQLSVVVYSTSLDHNVTSLLYEKGAHRYIRKPGAFSKLKSVIHQALIITAQHNLVKPTKENFIIQG